MSITSNSTPNSTALTVPVMLVTACLILCARQPGAQIPEGPDRSFIEERIQQDAHNLFKVRSKRAFPLSLDEAVRMAVSSNLDIAAATYGPMISRTDEDLALTAFDPLYFANFNLNDSETPTASALSGAPTLVQRATTLDTGIRKNLFTGGTYELKFDALRNRTNSSFTQLNPTYTSHLTAAATQPLLRGLGVRRNLSTWKQARNLTRIAESAEVQTVADTAYAVELAYWDLVFGYGELEVQQLSRRRANKLLEENRERLRVGQITEIDVISAEVDVARREEAVILAEQTIKESGDHLKFLIRPLDQEFLEGYDLVPTTVPRGRLPELLYLDSLRFALANRWELTQSRIELQNKGIRIQDAEHDLLPRLDILGSIAINTLNSHLDTAISDLDDGDFQTWNLRLEFEVPIGNRAAKALLRRSQLEMKQALVRHRALEDQVIQEVRRALRRAQTEAARLDFAIKTSELSQRQLEKEEARYDEGLSTAYRVLEIQEDVATDQTSELLARVNFQKAMVNLDLSTAQILERFGIVREPDQEDDGYTIQPPADYSRFGDLIDPR